MKVSVILPTYNEAGNIVALVQQILKVMPNGIDPDVIVVDDNSPDQTFSIVQEAFASNPLVRVLLRTQDRGLAKSIRYGIENAQGDYVLVMDTDFTHDPTEIPKMLHVAQVYDIVSGSRFCPGSSGSHQRRYRLAIEGTQNDQIASRYSSTPWWKMVAKCWSPA